VRRWNVRIKLSGKSWESKKLQEYWELLEVIMDKTEGKRKKQEGLENNGKYMVKYG